MVHTRMSALGWVIGGSETVVRSLLDALGPGGDADGLRLVGGPCVHARGLAGGVPLGVPRRAAAVGSRHRRGGPGLRPDPRAGADLAGRSAQRAPGGERGRGRPACCVADRGARRRLRGRQPVRATGRGGRSGADARRAAGDGHAAAPRRGDRVGARQADGHLRDRAGRRHDAVVHRHRDLARRVSVRVAGTRRRRVRGDRAGTRWRRASACAGRWGPRSATCSRRASSTEFAVAWIEERFGSNVNCAGWGSGGSAARPADCRVNAPEAQ